MKINAIPSYKYSVNNTYANKNVAFKASSNEQSSFFTSVDQYIYRGRMPQGSSEIKELKNFGISTIIDLTGQPAYNPDMVKELGMKYFNLSYFEEPGTGTLNTFFNIVKEARENNEKIYIHCLFGRDRTGLMVNLYKLFNKMPINEGLDKVMAQMIYDNYLSNIDQYIKIMKAFKGIEIRKPF